MRKRAFSLMAAVFLVGAGWIAARLARPEVEQPRLSTEGTYSPQPEPVGWVFGRLLNVQPSAYSPHGMGGIPQGERTTKSFSCLDLRRQMVDFSESRRRNP